MAEVRYSILGPLSVTVDGRPVAITAGRDRVVLAMLLLHAGRIVGLSEITEAVWGAQPPATARGQVQTCVSRLRRALPPDAIMTDPAGYGISAGPDELDAAVFARLVAQARSAGEPGSARRAYRKALDLWRGPACAEIDAPGVRRAAAALDEHRALAIEGWVELELGAGQAREILGELGELVQRFPLRERLRGQLMVALHRAGRQAEALAEYRSTRRVLSEELGIEPGKELQELHREILAGTLTGGEPTQVPPRQVVRCLPRTVGDFTGRRDVVDRLVGSVIAAGDSAPVVAVIDGMAGSGKTTLALHVAAMLGTRYPDAHLFVDLQGHSEQPPVEPGAALIVLLRQLGVPAADIPAETAERVALWRTEVARRRTLMILDNAASSAQIADLLPTAPGSVALVTARRRLIGLDGVHVESLPLLAPDEAVMLLERIVGERVCAEPEATAEVVRRCGGLPLAIRLAGARLAHRPRWRVADLVNRLGEAALPELAAEERTLIGAFTLTYRQLAEPVQRVFRLLGVYPGATFDALVVAALADLAPAEAGDVLDELVDVHLIDEPETGVFRLHDLLREHAAMLAADLPTEERRAALAGALDFQMHAIARAVSPGHDKALIRDLKGRRPLRPELVAAIDDPEGRVERERPNLSGFIEAAADAGMYDYAWQIPRTAWNPLFFRGYMDDIRELHQLALAKIEPMGDRSAIATVANYLASAYGRGGDDAAAMKYLLLAIRLREELGELSALATTYGNLAAIYQSLSRFTESIDAVLESRRILALSRDRTAYTPMLATISEVLGRLGRYDEALHYARLRLMSVIEYGQTAHLAAAFMVLQDLRYRRGDITAGTARRYLDVAMRLAVKVGYRAVQADVHNARALLLRDEGRYSEAGELHRQALEIVIGVRDSRHEAEFRHEYATTLRLSGDVAAAREMYEQALRIARASRLGYTIACAEAGLAACLDPDDPEVARLRNSSSDLFQRMGIDPNSGAPAWVERGWSGDD